MFRSLHQGHCITNCEKYTPVTSSPYTSWMRSVSDAFAASRPLRRLQLLDRAARQRGHDDVLGRRRLELLGLLQLDLVAQLQRHADAARSDADSVGAVSLDEEMTNLVTAQHAYEAAARVVTAVDEILATIVQRLGVVGR